MAHRIPLDILRTVNKCPSSTIIDYAPMTLYVMIQQIIRRRHRAMTDVNNPITPGEILLEEYLKPMGISQNAMARRHRCLPASYQRDRTRAEIDHLPPCPYDSARSSASRTNSGTVYR